MYLNYVRMNFCCSSGGQMMLHLQFCTPPAFDWCSTSSPEWFSFCFSTWHLMLYFGAQSQVWINKHLQVHIFIWTCARWFWLEDPCWTFLKQKCEMNYPMKCCLCKFCFPENFHIWFLTNTNANDFWSRCAKTTHKWNSLQPYLPLNFKLRWETSQM